MKTRKSVLVSLLVLLALLVSLSADARRVRRSRHARKRKINIVNRSDVRAVQGPDVKITSPLGGWLTDRVVTITGTVSDNKIRYADLVINGVRRGINVNQGNFKTDVLVSPGANLVEIIARNRAGEGSDSVTYYAKAPKLDLQVILNWDTDKTDIDLHVTDPSGFETFFGNRESPAGGRLDVDDVDGYGPEVFTLANALSGKYRVFVHYFSSNGNPQTVATVTVIMYEGTPMERKVTLQKVLTKDNDTHEIGTFEVLPPVEGLATAKK